MIMLIPASVEQYSVGGVLQAPWDTVAITKMTIDFAGRQAVLEYAVGSMVEGEFVAGERATRVNMYYSFAGTGPDGGRWRTSDGREGVFVPELKAALDAFALGARTGVENMLIMAGVVLGEPVPWPGGLNIFPVTPTP